MLSSSSELEGVAGEPPRPRFRLFRRRRFPGVWFWIWLLLLGIVAIFGKWIHPDPGVKNAVAYLGSLLLALALWCWFSFASAYRPATRMVGMLVGLALAVLIPLSVRVDKTSGGLGLHFAWRWTPRPDELLDQSIGSMKAQLVDMTRTSDGDYPQFLGPNRDSRVRGVWLDPDWKSHPPKERWRRKIGAGWSSFSIVNGNAVTMEQRSKLELVVCYDLETGEEKWAHVNESRHETTLGYIGPRSTPTIHEGNVYSLGATGHLVALEGSGGGVIWQRNILSDFGMDQTTSESAVAWGRASSPLIYKESVIVPVGGAPGGKLHGLAAFDIGSGEQLWTSGEFQAAYASAAVGRLGEIDQLLCVYEDFAAGHDPSTGAVLWRHPWKGKSNTDANCSQPVIVDDSHVLLTKGYGVGAELIEVVQKNSEWTTTTIWKNQRVMKTKFSNVATKDGFAYGLDDGILCCIDLSTGKPRWKKGRFGYGQILMVENLILVVSERGELALVDASPEAFIERGRIPVLDGQTWNNPALFGDRLLVRNAEEMACYQLATRTPDPSVSPGTN